MKTLLPVVILAGGLATRLRPLTERSPKSLIEVNGEPFIAHQLRLLHRQGIQKVVICLGFLGEKISDYVGDGSRFGLKVLYVDDGPRLLGTGGAIKSALPFLEEVFFVLYGDSYLPCDYGAVLSAFEIANKQILLTIFKNEGLWDASNIEFEDGAILRYDKKNRTDKMHYIDYGLSIMRRSAFDEVPDHQPYDLAGLYQAALKEHQLAAYEVKQRFYEIGSFSGVEEFSSYLEGQGNCI